MQECAVCKTNYQEEEFIDNICRKCLSGNKVKFKEKSFFKFLFSWKFYILPVLIGAIIGYTIYQGADEKILNQSRSVGFLLGLIMAGVYKANFVKKIAMFFLGGLFINIILFSTYFIVATSIITVFGESASLFISQKLKENSTLPKQINKDLVLLKYESNEKNVISQYLKGTKFGKNEMLQQYNFSQSLLKKDFDEILLESCSLYQDILSKGIVYNQVLLGKNNEVIVTSTMTDSKCKDFYTKKK